MDEFDNNILTINESICKNIDALSESDRGLLSQNILDKLRNFVEAINLKIYSVNHATNLNCYDDIVKANDYVCSRGELSFLSRFHGCLKISVSHYTLDDDSSVRLMLKYYDYLLRVREYLHEEFGINVLGNLEKYPIDDKSELSEYYENIAKRIIGTPKKNYTPQGRFYIQKERPFFVDGKTYYELTLIPADNYSGKFNRFTVFSDVEVSNFYAIKISVIDTEVTVLDRSMPIKILDSYRVAIRQCELNALAYILGYSDKIRVSANEYLYLMDYLTSSGKNLVEVIDLSQPYYDQLKHSILSVVNTRHIFSLLDTCRDISQKRTPGVNLVRYLLYRLRFLELRDQQDGRTNNLLSNLYLRNESIPFERMPFVSSLYGHNTRLSDVFACVSITGREHELLARIVRINTEQNSKLYTSRKDIYGFENIEELANRYNNALYKKHKPIRSLIVEKNNIFINGYESDTVEIIRKLKAFTGSGLFGYDKTINSWLCENPNVIDSQEKLDIIKKLFTDSNLAIVYGAAGTGKTTLLKHISNVFADEHKLFLANTNPALENLRRRIKVQNSSFNTVARQNYSYSNIYDIVFVDECSTISNGDMLKLLSRIQCKLLVLVGDVYQIEAVKFGNWFSLAKSFIPQKATHELQVPRRTEDADLLELWSKVRCVDPHISEFMVKKGYSSKLNDSIFDRDVEDQIILCLNYDGLYGINNINRFLQYDNPNQAVEWGVWTYKVNDPIIFNEYNKFYPTLYNNLKGWIRRINKTDTYIEFDIEIDMVLNAFGAGAAGIELLDCESENHSLIRFRINHYQDNDESEKTEDEVVPFQVAYAVSIHKAQGLEYQSVKVVVTNGLEELITHNVFYTAITRACSVLKVYWKPETGERVIKQLVPISNNKDANIIASKYKDLVINLS